MLKRWNASIKILGILQVGYFLSGILIVCLVAALSGCHGRKKTPTIGVLQWTEQIQEFRQTYQGMLDGLKARGYADGINVHIVYHNVEQDKTLALTVARQFVKTNVDLLVTLGTGSSLAALTASEKQPIPMVFSVVAAPRATGILHEDRHSDRQVTGVSMEIPVNEQFEIVKDALPTVVTLGIVYCTEMPQAVATGQEAASVAADFGWTPVVMAFPKEELPQLEQKVRTLLAQVDALYLPADPLLGAPDNFATILRLADAAQIPVVAMSQGLVERGAFVAVHCDLYEIGQQTADLIVQVLEGGDVEMIPVQQPAIKKLSVNLKKAQQLHLPISRHVILKTDTIFD